MKTALNKKLFIFLFVFLILINCSSESQKLIKKRYPEGFSLKHPENWHVQVVDKEYILISPNDVEKDLSFILVYPFFLNELTKSRSWLHQNLPQLSRFFKKVTFEKTEQIRNLPDEWVAKFSFKRDNLPFQGLAICSIQEKSGILYVMATSDTDFEEKRNQLINILESFQFEKPDQNKQKIAKRPKIQYTAWQDSIEQAFSLDVPRGWAVNGGTYRRASVDLIHVLQAISPDQKIRIQFNDSNIPIFTVPSPVLAMSGFREGSWYSPGYGVKMMVKRYTPGFYFLNEYIMNNYSPYLSNFKIASQKDRPDVVASFNRIYSKFMVYGISFTLHAGELAFSFEQNSQPFIGYGLALTQITQSMGMQGGTWSVALIILYTCPASEDETVRQISEHMFLSVKMNPHWVASQQQLTANVSQIVAQTNQEISRIINDSYWSRQRTLDDVNRKFSNTILGVTDVIDPATGEKWKAEAGHNYYWRKDYTDLIIGTEVFERPDINFSFLKEF